MAAFVQARWFTKPSTPRRIDLAVIHSMELDERLDTAEACANYFRIVPETNKASAHTCLDTNSRVDCVKDEHVAYAAPGANHNGVHVELAGRARQTRDEWLDAYSLPMLRVQLAAWLAEKHRLHGIPLVYLDAVALRRGERGVTTHRQVSLAFRKSDHWDPGDGFPMDVALTAARRFVDQPAPDEELFMAAFADTADARAYLVTSWYITLAGRQPDPAGLAHWLDRWQRTNGRTAYAEFCDAVGFTVEGRKPV